MSEKTRTLYLNLLVQTLSYLVYGPSPKNPWFDGLFRPDAQPGRDRNSPAHTMVGILRLKNVLDLTQRALDEGIAGNFIETGVWRGGCCILMRGVLAANGVEDRLVYVADSFDGIPPPNVALYPQDEGKNSYLRRDLAVPLEDVQANFARYDLLDDQVRFVKGYFSDTLPGLDTGPLAVIRLDGDAYESTYVALEHLYPKLSPGGFAIIDDYGAVPRCRAAVDDYRKKHGINETMEQVDFTAVYWRKPLS